MDPEDVVIVRKKYERLLDDARIRHVPTIVLWGPGGHNSSGFQKRLRIKNSIRQESPKATVILPDDPQIQSVTKLFVRDPDLQEILQALIADLVFALDTAAGVGEEIARYSQIENVFSKLIVISRDSNRRGYLGIIRKGLNIEFFSEEELELCDRASQFCREQVRAWLIKRIAKQGSNPVVN